MRPNGMRPDGMRPNAMRPNGRRLKGYGSRERGLKECGPTEWNPVGLHNHSWWKLDLHKNGLHTSLRNYPEQVQRKGLNIFDFLQSPSKHIHPPNSQSLGIILNVLSVYQWALGMSVKHQVPSQKATALPVYRRWQLNSTWWAAVAWRPDKCCGR